jgi:hypothetical protein
LSWFGSGTAIVRTGTWCSNRPSAAREQYSWPRAALRFACAPVLALVSLNGKDAAQIIRLIEELSDQLVTNRVPGLDPKQDTGWRALEGSYEGVTLKIKTPFLDVEKKL